MGFLSRLFGFGSKKPKNPPPQKEKQKRRSFIASLNSNSHNGTPSRHQVDDPNKHAIAVAAATAAVAEAALAAAHAAAEVVRLTSNVGRNANVAHRLLTAELAAVKIQSAFRGYLARRALKALKALVKLQALVRGHMVRKQTANMLRRMQTLVRVQARARANRAHLSESFHSSSKSSLSRHPVPAAPDINDCQLRAYSSKFEGPSILKRCGSNSNFRDIINLDKAHGSSKWLDHWMEESLWNNRRDISLRNGHADDEKCDKILEVDTWKPHLNSQESKRTFQTSPNAFASDYNKESFMTYNSPSKHSTKAPNPIPSQATPSSGGVLSFGSFKLGRDETALRTADNSPQVHSLSSRPGSSARRGPFTPTRSEYAWGYFGGYSGHPNYMANTESFRAKVRSQSAPRQRLEFEKFGSTRRSVQGLWDAGIDSDKRFAEQAEYGYKAYSASGQLNRVGSANLR